jgi:hypothetical protein
VLFRRVEKVLFPRAKKDPREVKLGHGRAGRTMMFGSAWQVLLQDLVLYYRFLELGQVNECYSSAVISTGLWQTIEDSWTT